MRPLEEILRTYNIVNSRAVSRYTVRFAAAFLLAGVGFVAVAMLLTGGSDGGTVPHESAAHGESGTTGETGAPGLEPLLIETIDQGDTVYIGYAAYDPARADEYDAAAVQEALVDWTRDHRYTLFATEEVEAPDGRLIGYLVHLGAGALP